MKFKAPVSIKWVAEFIGAKLIGDDTIQVDGLSEVHKVTPGDISFVDIEKYYARLLESNCAAIIINKEVECPAGKALLIIDKPIEAYNKLATHFTPFEPATKMIADTAIIAKVCLDEEFKFNQEIGLQFGVMAIPTVTNTTTVTVMVMVQIKPKDVIKEVFGLP